MRRLLLILLLGLLWQPQAVVAAPLDGIVKVLAGRAHTMQQRLVLVDEMVASARKSLQEAESALALAQRSKDQAAAATAREAVALSRDTYNGYRELRADAARDLQRARKSLQLARRLQQLSGAQPVSSAVIEQRGRVERSSGDGAWSPLAADAATPLQSGDALRTGPGGGAEFLLQDGRTAAQVGADTELRLTVDELGNAAVDLTRGAFYAAVVPLLKYKQRFEVRTPTAALAVRGTRFAVNEGPGGTELLVLDGTVAVTPNGGGEAVVVKAGQRLVLAPGAAVPAPTAIDWERTRRWWREEAQE